MPEGVPSAPVPLVRELATRLAAAGVSYCHWKSNEAIAKSLAAENDLDLLVEGEHLSRFLEVAAALGFRLALPRPQRQVPGHLVLYGLDQPTGRIVQIDAQTRLVVGDDTTKNYRIPMEAAYLEDLDRSGVLPLPRPEMEYLAFVVRMVLKHAAWDAQLSYKARLTSSERRELAYLEERIDPAEVERLRSEHLRWIGRELLADCRRALGRDLGPPARAGVARRLTRALADQGRRGPARDTGLKLSRRIGDRVRRTVLPLSLQKRLASGGSVVAVVGGDGSGKSSTVADLVGFLGRHFATRRFHLGKPKPSLIRLVATRVIRRLGGSAVPTGIPPWEAAGLDVFPGYGYLVVHLLIARDRHRAARAARRMADRGGISICDRYPVPGLETMDRARLEGLAGVEERPLARWMRDRESLYYERMPVPDVVLVLRVDPDVAVARRQEQDAMFVRRRAEEIHQREWKEPNVFVLDADRPLADVQAEARSLLWARL
ncbi:MAG: hypothetical protein ACLFWM_11300 [Actinomycetota bacterium]